MDSHFYIIMDSFLGWKSEYNKRIKEIAKIRAAASSSYEFDVMDDIRYSYSYSGPWDIDRLEYEF